MVDTSKMTFSELADSVTALEDELYDTRQKLEQSQARVAELESQARQLICSGTGPLADAADRHLSGLILRKQAEAVENYSAALGMWLKELPGKPCASFVEGVVSSAEQADRYAQRLRQQADEIEKAGGE